MSQENVEILGATRIALPFRKDQARRGRSLDERLIVRFPALVSPLAGVVMRLSPRSRVRRLMITRRVRQAYAAINRRDFDLVLVGFDPEIEYRPSADLMPPDLGAISHGHDG